VKRAIEAAAVAAFVLFAIGVNVRVFREPLSEWFRPQPILTLAGIIFGFIILRWQLSAQHANTLKANAEKGRNDLNLEIYRDVAVASEEADRAVMLLFELRMRADAAWEVGITRPPAADEFRDAANRCTDAMLAVLARIQKWEIAFDGGHSKFAASLKESLGHMRDAATSLLSVMATPGADTARLRGASVGVRDAVIELTSLLWDLRIESQNLLLGGLFEYRTPRRRPTNPSVKVTTLR